MPLRDCGHGQEVVVPQWTGSGCSSVDMQGDILVGSGLYDVAAVLGQDRCGRHSDAGGCFLEEMHTLLFLG